MTVGLAPLSVEETVRLMGVLSGRPLMEAATQQALVERSGGNPLYVTEYVRLATDQGWFDRRGQELPLPDTIQAVVASRLDLLEAVDKTLLQAAAVIGRVFWSGALSFVEGADQTAVQGRLRSLVSRDLIRPVRRSSMQGQDEYTFAHVVIRDVAYGRLTKDDRARLHEATARWLEAVSGDRVIDVAELLAHHHSTALELRPSADLDRRRNIYRFQMLAGERTKAVDARRAKGFYRAAVELAGNDLERGLALLELGEHGFDGVEEAAATLDQAASAFAAAGNREGEARAKSARGRLEWFRGHTEEADRYHDQAQHLVEGLPPSSNVAQVLTAAAAGLQLRGREEEALELVERAIEVARAVGDTATYSRALVVRGSALIQLGNRDAVEDVREGLRIQLDRNDADLAMRTYNNLATFLIEEGRVEEGAALISDAIEYAKQRGLESHVDWSKNTKCEALFPLGQWQELSAITGELLAADDARGGSQVGIFALAWSALVRHFRGEKVLGTWREVLEGARRIQDLQALMPALAHGIGIAESGGDHLLARTLAAELVEHGRTDRVFFRDLLWCAAGPLMRLGMGDQLADLIEGGAEGTDWPDAQVMMARAALSEAGGDRAAALALLLEVLAIGDALHLRVPMAQVRIDAARYAQRLGDPGLAERLLDEAEATAAPLEARRFLDAIVQLRAEPSARRA